MPDRLRFEGTRRTLSLAAALWLLAAPAAADPPPETLERVHVATRPAVERDFHATYTVSYRNVQSRPDGSEPDERRAVLAAVKRGPGRPALTLVEASRNGEDRTDESRAQIEAIGRDLAGSDDGRAVQVRMSEVLGLRPPTWVRMLRRMTGGGDSEGSSGLAGYRLPGPAEPDTYAFGPTERDGGACVGRFAPAPGLESEDGIVAGRLAWDCDGGDPLWLEAAPAKLPPFVQEMAVRLEFERTGAVMIARKLRAEGLGGFLLYKRRFLSGFEITDFRAAPPDGDGARALRQPRRRRRP